MTSPLTKSKIRQACLAYRKQLSLAFIRQASTLIIQNIRTLANYQQAQHIGWYHPIKGEADLSPLWASALDESKSCYFPVIRTNQTMAYLPITEHTLWSNNQYGIPEPTHSQTEIEPKTRLDLIFIPVVAFDDQLTRLGMGAGYYDTYLSQHPHEALLIGVAYDWQKQDLIPKDIWDIPLDLIVTEKVIYTK